MATTVDTLLVRIEADMSDLRKSLNRVERDIDKSSKGISKSFKGLGTIVKGAIGVAVIGQLGRAGMAMINLASDVEEMQSKSAVVFGKFRDEVVAELEEFGNQVGRSTHELEGMASSIQDTFVPMGFARGEAAKLSVQLSKLAVDVASFNNASDTETMEAFQSALVGNHETVRRFGIVITEAEVKQELLRMGITKTAKEITAAEKVQARLNLIIAGTSDAQGDATRTADSFANRTKALTAEFEELRLKLADDFLPIATQLLNFLIEGVGRLEDFLIAFGIIEDLRPVVDQLAEAQRKLNEHVDDYEYSELDRIKLEEDVKRLKAINREIMTFETRRNNMARSKVVDLGTVKVGDSKSLSDDEVDLLEKNAIMREEIRLQKQLFRATRDNNEAGIVQAKREIAALPMRLKLTNLTEELTDAEQKYTDFKTQSGDATQVLIDTNIKQSETLQKLKDDYDALGDVMVVIHPLYEEQIAAVHSMSSSLSNAFADMLMSGKFNLNSLGDIFRSFVRTMIAKAIELFVINRILNSIFPSAFTPIGGGGFVPKFSATGGSAYGNQPMVVGERGAEIFVPHSAGTIMNSNNTRSAMSGGGGATIVQNINISTGVQQTVRTEIRSMMPEIARSASGAVADSKRRGGSFGRAFA